MRWRLGRCAGVLLLLAGCTAQPRTVPQPAPAPALAGAPAFQGVCRIGADGAIPLADRGFGGTGISATGGSGTVDEASSGRGIGGTGLIADRGIGGTGAPQARTGIVGVITGFASVCLAGQEVAYGPDLPVSVDGAPAGIDVLRAGQVAAIEAAPPAPLAPDGQPVALRLVVRHEVSGPLERVEPDGALRIAGQRVLPPANQPDVAFVPGTWLSVSGFRREDATIVATRLDPRGPGEVLVRGIMIPAGAALRIGTLEIRPAPGQVRQPGVPVVAVGRLSDGVLYADTVEPDGLLVDPGAFFGPSVTVLYVEGYADGGILRFGRGLRIGAPFAEGRGLARLVRRPGGGFAASFVRRMRAGPFLRGPFLRGPFRGGPFLRPGAVRRGPFGPRLRGGEGSRFEPAPVPNRALRQPGGFGGGRRGEGGYGRRGFAPRDRGSDAADGPDNGLSPQAPNAQGPNSQSPNSQIFGPQGFGPRR